MESKGEQGPPLHSHAHEDESFYVLSGQLEVTCDGSTRTAARGDFVHIPRGTFHTFRNTVTEGSRLLVILTPGNFAHLFREIGTSDVHDARDPLFLQQAQEKLLALSGAYGLTIAPPH